MWKNCIIIAPKNSGSYKNKKVDSFFHVLPEYLQVIEGLTKRIGCQLTPLRGVSFGGLSIRKGFLAGTQGDAVLSELTPFVLIWTIFQ